MKITIAGGGIAGLTTAIALNKVGLKCEVYERAEAINEVGAGIWIQPNALKVFDWLGLGDAVREKAALLNRVEITNLNLIPFRKYNQKVTQDQSGNKIAAIHRAELQKLLFQALPQNALHLGSDYKAYSLVGDKLNVTIGDKTILTDLLIGADGIHSKVRKDTFQNSSLRFSGQTCWRGISNTPLPPAFQNSGIESWGNKVRFGFSQIAENKVYWFAVINTNQNENYTKACIKKIYTDFHPLVHEIIDNTNETKIINGEISDLKRLAGWSKNQVVLVGDAAHATTPNMGQGAGQGIEDAYYLANFLAKSKNISAALRQFEQTRREKVDYVVNNSWRFGQMAHSVFGQAVMKTIMKLTPEKVMMKQMQKLYSIQESFD